jgi:hypothetical protein
MAPILPKAPTPKSFAKAWAREIVEPAARAAAGTDGKVSAADARKVQHLDGALALAARDVDRARKAVGGRAPAVEAVVERVLADTETAARKAAGGDGRVSWVDAQALPPDLAAGYAVLRGHHETREPVRFSARVLDKVAAEHGLTPEALRTYAVSHAHGDAYLSRLELNELAKALVDNSSELGLVTDIDKTVLPPETDAGMPPPYPGVAALFRELEFANGGKSGDMHYVTARSPERIALLPAWFAKHALPDGPIDTGTGSQPWIAEPEKVRDISAIFEANPSKRFVLFGDSSHRDPEVYRKIREKYPDQVALIVIHRMTERVSASRVEGMELVGNYAYAAAAIYKAGLMDEAAARRVMVAARAEGLEFTDNQVEELLA